MLPKGLMAEMLIAEEEIKASDFGKNFIWGTATAAYQIEGGWDADGKGESIWDHFSHKPGKIKRHETADTAADFYHRYESDIALMPGEPKPQHLAALERTAAYDALIDPGGGG